MRNRNIFSGMIAALAGLGLALAIPASAQTNYTGIQASPVGKAQVYFFQNGTTGVIPPLSTNTFWNYPAANAVSTNAYNVPSGATATSNLLSLAVAQFDYVGFTFAFTGTATSTNDFLIYASYDGGTSYGVNPIWSVTALAPGAASYITNGVLDVHGASYLALVSKNKGTTLATNVEEALNLKSPKYGAVNSSY